MGIGEKVSIVVLGPRIREQDDQTDRSSKNERQADRVSDVAETYAITSSYGWFSSRAIHLLWLGASPAGTAPFFDPATYSTLGW